jgi:hypothetical protein
MNKIGIYLIIAFILSSPLLLPTSSGLATSNFTVSTSGVVQYNILAQSQTPIKKCVYAFGLAGGLNDLDTTFIAEHFDLFDVESKWQIPLSNLQSIKAKNPNITIIGYKGIAHLETYQEDWSEVNMHEDWFMHDVNGNRIEIQGYPGSYLMDIGNAGYRQHWVSFVNNKINNPQYDGVLGDNAWNQLAEWGVGDLTKIPFDIRARWHTDMVGMLQYIKANLLPGKILVINSDEYDTNDYINIVDGVCREHAIHAIDADPNNYNSWNWLSWLDVLSRDSATEKIVMVVSGTTTPAGTSQADIDRVLKFCYSAFLCALNGPNMYFSFHTEIDSAWRSSDGSKGYYPIMDTDIGAATGFYYSSQNVYMRDFTKGKVLLNPSSRSYTVNLGLNYRLLDGTIVSSVTLNAWSGEVLLYPT